MSDPVGAERASERGLRPSEISLELAGVAIVIGAAILIRQLVHPWMGPGYPFITIFPAVCALAWWRGFWPGAIGAIVGGMAAEYLFVDPRGRLFPVTTPGWVGLVMYLGACALIVMLGERRRRAAARAREGDQAASILATIVESTPDAVISKTLEGRITSWNPGAERIFGYTAAEAVGQHIFLIIPDERRDEETSILSRVRRGERIVFDTQRRTKDGRLLDISLSVSPLHDGSRRVVGASKIARDITEKKRAERERDALLASERMARSEAERLSRVKDDFVATLSHELRTPLNAILGWSQLIRRPDASPEDITEGLAVIERNARSQSQMIEDLLDVSRIVSGKIRLDVQRVKLVSVIEQAIASAKPAAEGKQIRLQAILDPRTNIVNGDPTRLQQIVWNLLSNAIKFTPKGGRVQIVLRRVNSSVLIEVSDTGIGVRPDMLDVIFERFRQVESSTTRRFAGLGLGLSIVRHLTELHGGSVRASSEGEGKGATFTVELPLAVLHPEPAPEQARVQPVHAGERPSLAKADLSGVRVLVVDDERDSRAVMTRVLRECGAEVHDAESVDDALRLFREIRPDILLSDIGMPQRDGYELIRVIRSMRPEEGGGVPAAALTALARSEDRTRAMMSGFQVHVSKPIEPSELVAVVASLARLSVRANEATGGDAMPGRV